MVKRETCLWMWEMEEVGGGNGGWEVWEMGGKFFVLGG